MTEEWKQVTGYEGRYEVSNLGRIKTVCSSTDKIRKTHIINSGYEATTLHDGSNGRTKLVHRLVAREFCEGYAEGLQVNHKDANRLNNAASNLEWVTPTENIRDCMSRGTHDVKSAHAVAHVKRRRPVAQVSLDGDLVAIHESAREAAKIAEVHENCISRVCRGVREKSAGFYWFYLDSR